MDIRRFVRSTFIWHICSRDCFTEFIIGSGKVIKD